MLTLYVGERKVAWEEAGTALAEPGIDWRAVTIRNSAGRVVYRVEPVEQDPQPHIVHQAND